jgi:hypothetical protein
MVGFVFLVIENKKRMKKILLTLLMAATAHVQAAPYFQTGNDFLALTEHSRVVYVLGVIDGIGSTYPSKPPLFCLPAQITGKQALAVAQKYLNDQPEKLHEQAATLIALSLHTAFPCK